MSVHDITLALVHVPTPNSSATLKAGFPLVINGPTFSISSGVQTLSSKGAERAAQLQGLVYVPNIEKSSACRNETSGFFPSNATQSLVSNNDAWGYIALAPWISTKCNLAFLAAAQQQQTVAFIFYRSLHGADELPSATDPAWSLGDGERWTMQVYFPVYAIPLSTGQSWMDAVSAYAGTTTASSPAQALPTVSKSSLFRFQAYIDVGDTVGLPSLWDYLLIAVAALAGIMGFVSLFMHCLQGHRRRSLRRRVASGEVDLAALGIKRLVVPQNMLDSMPLYTFEKTTAQELKQEAEPIRDISEFDLRQVSTAEALKSSRAAYSQLTCAICLEDFKVNETRIREMPCKHVFHPECIDDFLLKTSSLCPLCKKSALPKGYCPSIITNSMVRRDRTLRSEQDQRSRQLSRPNQHGRSIEMHNYFSRSSPVAADASRTRPVARLGRAVTQETSTSTAIATETISSSTLEPTIEAIASPNREPATETSEPVTAARITRDWGRQRALALLGEPRMLEEPSSRSTVRPNLIRRVWNVMFPGFQ